MGDSTYSTPLKLYYNKVSDSVEEDTSNAYIKQKGNEAEDSIRALFELRQGESFQTALLVMEGLPLARVSLDGYSEDKEKVAEFKLGNAADWELASAGIVPQKHKAQVHWEMMIADAGIGYYVSHRYEKPQTFSIDKLAVVEVLPNREYQKLLLETATKFWTEHVMKRIPPEPSDEDYVKLKKKGLTEIIRSYECVCADLDRLTASKESLKKMLVDIAKESGHSRCMAGDLKLVQQSRVGAVDYSLIPELKKVDIEQYRKPGTTFWSIK
jgi:predicted phage-related endonuclease